MIKKVKLFGFDRSAHMKELHKQGRYLGTSRIGQWNSSEEKKLRMQELRSRNSLDKSSRGYGSEYQMRLTNRRLLYNKFQSQGSGYLYVLEFPSSIKIGFSKDYEGRVSYLGGRILRVIQGSTELLADLEFNTMIKFQDYTQLSSDKTRYTEFIDKKAKTKVLKFIDEEVKKSKDLNLIR